jgi:hypothetical protein
VKNGTLLFRAFVKHGNKIPRKQALSPSFYFFLTKFEFLELGVFLIYLFLGTGTLQCFVKGFCFCCVPLSTSDSTSKCGNPWVCQYFEEIQLFLFPSEK